MLVGGDGEGRLAAHGDASEPEGVDTGYGSDVLPLQDAGDGGEGLTPPPLSRGEGQPVQPPAAPETTAPLLVPGSRASTSPPCLAASSGSSSPHLSHGSSPSSSPSSSSSSSSSSSPSSPNTSFCSLRVSMSSPPPSFGGGGGDEENRERVLIQCRQQQLGVAESKEERSCIEEKKVDSREKGAPNGGGSASETAGDHTAFRGTPSLLSSAPAPSPPPSPAPCSSFPWWHDGATTPNTTTAAAGMPAAAAVAEAKTEAQETPASPGSKMPTPDAGANAGAATTAGESGPVGADEPLGAAVSNDAAGPTAAVAVMRPAAPGLAATSPSTSTPSSAPSAEGTGEGEGAAPAPVPAATGFSPATRMTGAGVDGGSTDSSPTGSEAAPGGVVGAAAVLAEQWGLEASRPALAFSDARDGIASENGSGGNGSIGRGGDFAWSTGGVGGRASRWPDASWRSSWGEGSGSLPLASAGWRGFERNAAIWQAVMNPPVAWDAVMLPPPAGTVHAGPPLAAAVFTPDGGEGWRGGEGGTREARALTAIVAPGGSGAGGNDDASAGEGGGEAGAAAGASAALRLCPDWDMSQRLSDDVSTASSRPRLIGGMLENEDGEAGGEGRRGEELAPEEACFEAFNLNEDVAVLILGNLDARDLARAAATSRGWRRCTSSRILWGEVYARDFLGHVPAGDVAGGGTTGPSLDGRGGGGRGGGCGGRGDRQDRYRQHPMVAAISGPVSGYWASGGGSGGGGPQDFLRAVWPPHSSSAAPVAAASSRWQHGGIGRFSSSSSNRPPHPSGEGVAGMLRYDGSAAGGALGSGGRNLFCGGGGGEERGATRGFALYGGGRGRHAVTLLEGNPKEQYTKQLAERKARLERQQRQEVLREARKRADRRRQGYERGLDYLHVRVLPPVLGVSLALTLVFLAAWLDGDLQKWDYWRVLSPMWVACIVAAVAVATALRALRERASQRSSARSTFSGLRGGVRYFMTEVVREQPVGIASGVLLIVLFTLELVVLGLQIEGIIHANWFAVFLPLFFFFLILCLSPCLQWTSWGDGGAYLLGMLLGWTPAVLCVILVCSRLQGDNVSMNVIMSPLWAVDLVLILSPVAMALAVAIRRRRRGEPVEAMLVHTLAASWCLLTPVLAPLVAFEVALAVYVEGKRDTLTAAEVFTPIIVWCCVLSLILCGYACSYPARQPDSEEGSGGADGGGGGGDADGGDGDDDGDEILDHNDPTATSTFAPTASIVDFATHLPRPAASAPFGGLGGGSGGVGLAGRSSLGANRRRQLSFPPATISQLPASLTSQHHHHPRHQHPHHHHPRHRHLHHPHPHRHYGYVASGTGDSGNDWGGGRGVASPHLASMIALRSRLADEGVTVGIVDPPSPRAVATAARGRAVAATAAAAGGNRARAGAGAGGGAGGISFAAAQGNDGGDGSSETEADEAYAAGRRSGGHDNAEAFAAWDYFGGLGIDQRRRDDNWAV